MVCIWPFGLEGLWLRYTAKFDPFLSLDCARGGVNLATLDEGGDRGGRGGLHHAEGAAAAKLPPGQRLGQQRQRQGAEEELQAAALILAIQGHIQIGCSRMASGKFDI